MCAHDADEEKGIVKGSPRLRSSMPPHFLVGMPFTAWKAATWLLMRDVAVRSADSGLFDEA